MKLRLAITTCSAALLIMGVAFLNSAQAAERDGQLARSQWPPATAKNLSGWRGIQLRQRTFEEYGRDGGPRRDSRFLEEDFHLVSRLGFNVVRLLVDSRMFMRNGQAVKRGAWSGPDASAPFLRELDDVIAWGNKYRLHIFLAVANPPGYVNFMGDENRRDLWTDAEPQRALSRLWGMIAARYKSVGNERLSFNPVTEPRGANAEQYLEVMRQVVEAIRRESPDRAIICDGRGSAHIPAPELVPLGAGQAVHCYDPVTLCLIGVPFPALRKGTRVAPPQWPRPYASGWLKGPKTTVGEDAKGSLVVNVKGVLPAPAKLLLRVDEVLGPATLVVEADESELLRRDFAAGPGTGEWKQSEYDANAKAYRCFYDRDCAVDLSSGTRQIRVRAAKGTWVHVTQISLTVGDGPEAMIDLEGAWGDKMFQLSYDPSVPGSPWRAERMQDREYLRKHIAAPWKALEAKGVSVVVGEFGIVNKVPQDVAMRWMEDWLSVCKEAGWGWILWRLDGPAWGLVDGQRPGVEYEDFESHKLDRKMLELLQRN